MKSKQPEVYTGLSTSEGSYIFVLYPIIDEVTGESLGLMEVGTELTVFNQENNRVIVELFLNSVVISIALLLITSELLILHDGQDLWKRRKKIIDSVMKNQSVSERRRRILVPVSMLRILVFLIFFVTNMTRGFFPIYLMKLVGKGQTVLGMSPELLLSTALAAEVLFGAIFSFVGEPIIRKLGRRKTAIIGSVVFTGGLLVRAIIPTILSMILGNAVMGAGWGVLLLIVQVIIAEKEETEKNQGFTDYTASSLSGMNSGVVVGAF